MDADVGVDMDGIYRYRHLDVDDDTDVDNVRRDTDVDTHQYGRLDLDTYFHIPKSLCLFLSLYLRLSLQPPSKNVTTPQLPTL